MNSNQSAICKLFFSDLKRYNNSNFKALANADLTNPSPEVLKAFSSVITRYFIFCEKHPTITDLEARVLYFQLKIDMIARFLSNYPDVATDDLIAFQTELKYYIKRDEEADVNDQYAATL